VALRRRLAVRLLIMMAAVALAGTLCVAVVAPTTAVGQGYGVVNVYKDIDLRGDYSTLDANKDGSERGYPDAANIPTAAGELLGHDTVSSVEVLAPGDCSVTLYEHPSYGGRSMTFDREILDLRDYGFNDITSSLKVRCSRVY
jgi:hypothetical protein